jgi:hypothetical protein
MGELAEVLGENVRVNDKCKEKGMHETKKVGLLEKDGNKMQ